MKRVLIISYHFAPDARVGGLRAQKFAKYLPIFGWQPVVLTVNEKYYPIKDMERCNDVSCEVVRTGKFASLRESYLKIKKIIVRLRDIKNASNQHPKTIVENQLELSNKSMSRLKKFILSFFWLPDDQTGWIVPAVIKSLKLIKKNNIKTVMTTSPPHSTQIIGLLLKKITNCRWVVDLRDPWCQFPGIKKNVSTNFFNKIELWLEKKVIENADVVILNTDVVMQRYVETFTTLPPVRYYTKWI